MELIDEYRNRDLIRKIQREIAVRSTGSYTFMEVCGGHTMAIHRFGIPGLLPGNINLVSGPGCPVCVTEREYIDQAIEWSKAGDNIITTFGDMIRVPGYYSTLGRAHSEGADIRIVLSAADALETARQNPRKKVIFMAIGFETTAPGTAFTLSEAKEEGIRNFFVFSAHKIMPPAMEAIIRNGTTINGFICPGHVSAITGSSVYDFIAGDYGIGCVVSGFEPLDLLQSVLMLVNQVNADSPVVEIQYRRVVTGEGNLVAQKKMKEVFKIVDDSWRGLGVIEKSGLQPADEYEAFDALKNFPLIPAETVTEKECICGEILRGMKKPADCRLFGVSCIPENPVGACMVSGEGACGIYYRYSRNG